MGWKWGACVSKSLYPQLSTTPPTRGPHVEAECVVDDRVFAGISEPQSLNKEEEGRMVKDTDAGDGVSVKTPGGRQRETTSLLFSRIWLVRRIK